jgi:hypothetical protein
MHYFNMAEGRNRIVAKIFSFARVVAVVAWVAMLTAASDTWAQQPTGPAPAGGKPLRGMLVTGGCCHDYDAQRVLVTEGLSQRLGPIEWTVHQYEKERTTRATIYDTPDWAAGFDFVVHNECFGEMRDPALIRSIIEGHKKSGAAAILVHCSMHSYRNSEVADEWRQFIGVTSTYHEKGKRSLAVIPTEAGKAGKLVAGLGDVWNTPNGELYIIKQVWPGTTVLAQAYSTEEKADQPVIWQRESDGVRVFATTLGHHNEEVRSETWQAIVAAGTKWAIGKE